jgi:diguanylate cyclase (GGDEF)-like protein
MSGSESTAGHVKRTEAERRAYERHPIHLPAEIVIDGVGVHACIVRDYCLGGMLLVFEQGQMPQENGLALDVRLRTNDLIGIQCAITVEGRQNKLRFKARIAHTDSVSAGVAFQNPDLNALQLIRQFARLHPAPEYSPPSPEQTQLPKQHGFKGQSPQQLIASCNSMLIDSAGLLITQFHDVVTENLFEFAKESADLTIQNAFFQALSTFTNNNTKLKSLFVNAIRDRLLNGKIDDSFDGEQPQEFTAESLELVEDKAFDKWLAMSSIVNRVESDLGTLLSPMEKRLSVIIERPIDKKNNPYGPCVFVRSFQEALEFFELPHNVSIKCFDVFRKVIINFAKDIYTKLNNYLIEQDVLPVIKREIVRPQQDDAQTKSAPQPETAAPIKDSEATIAKAAVPASTAEMPSKDGAKSVEPASPQQQDLYSLVGELRELQQQLKTTYLPAGPQIGQLPLTAGAPSQQQTQPILELPTYSKPELLEALSNIKLLRRAINDEAGTGNTGIFEQLHRVLESQYGETTEKAIGKEEAYVIDVAENVFSSLLADKQVANSVRPWIEKLGVPVVKMALLDKSLFVNKSHVVRQVINKLAELEILAEAEDDDDQQAIKRAFTWIIDLINNQFDGTTRVFARAMQQLELLTKIQQQSYEQNLKLVISEFRQEDRQNIDGAADVVTTSSDELKNDEWLRRVHRLIEGHWILFDANTDNPKRLKVAWIAERAGKYVFVNVMGRKDRVLCDKELATLFRTADAVVLDGADEPIMDRAQYTMLQNLHKQLLYQASHDELTGLINRREFEKSIQEAINDALGRETKHAICQFDIDKFKVITNTYGYDAGDTLIKQIVALVQKTIEPSHILARIGSDEFGLILQENTLDDAMAILDEIMIAFEDFRFEWNDDRVSVTISAGLAIINGQSKDITSVLQAAESSCALAKEMGGNRIQLFHSGHSKLSRRKEKMVWATKVDKALDENSLFLRCQKIAPIQPHLLEEMHYEVLLGLTDEFGGQAALQEFILAAEQYNRMLDIDRWVIRTTFNWLSRHEDMLTDISGFSINLSGHSLNDENLIDFIYQQVRETAVPIEKICFEITETAGISNLSDAADFITTIKGTGCRFSLDDFGTGMSSYAYLKSLPVDFLKIDGAFIRDIDQNPSDYAIVKSICEIGHFMEKSVVAEFVKNEETIKILKDIGVDYIQGYGVGKPHLLDDLIK